ncbi:hypothetical protein pipiens_005961 [Culex pipiens pipiens]|uniref:FLYWCH-type domain-containing protein n=1 Tax=Culex pipiens pipiens TaxID=38569 RepID=A0ABD1DSG1_CULPP
MWHNTEFETVQNSRGQFVVVFQNYRYGKDKQRFEQGQPVMSWRCTSKNSGCMARIATRGYNLLKAFGRPHNHPPPGPSKFSSQFPNLQPDQIPKVLTWYNTTEIQSVTNDKGGQLLLFRGHKYSQKKVHLNGNSSWKCHKYNCRATLLTRCGRDLRIGVHGHIHPRCGSFQKTHEADYDVEGSDPDNPALLLDHEEPVPQAWYTVPLKFGRNSKGTMNLEFRGNTYNVHRRATSSDAISWRCAKLSCVCNVTTRGSDRIRISSRPHNHPEVIPRTTRGPVLKPRENPLPCTWYTVPLKLIENSRGSKSLLFREYIYKKRKTTSKTTKTWVCAKQGNCLARVVSRDPDQLKVGIHRHNHPPWKPREPKYKPILNPEFLDMNAVPPMIRPPVALQDSQVPQLSLWYTAKLQFKKTEKGLNFVLFRGHRYNLKNTNRRGIHCWKCYKYKCRATVFTRGFDNIKLGVSGHNHSRFGQHQKSHPDDLDREVEDPDNPPVLLDSAIPTAQNLHHYWSPTKNHCYRHGIRPSSSWCLTKEETKVSCFMAIDSA